MLAEVRGNISDTSLDARKTGYEVLSKQERKEEKELAEVRRYRRHLRSRSRVTFYKTVRLQSFWNSGAYRVGCSE